MTTDHEGHGSGDENGPDDPDCGCRGTKEQAGCASSGCGFCIAATHAAVERFRAYVTPPRSLNYIDEDDLIAVMGELDERNALTELIGSVVCGMLLDNERQREHVATHAICAWCGHDGLRLPDEMRAHAEQCTEHPMHALRAERDALREVLERPWFVAQCQLMSGEKIEQHNVVRAFPGGKTWEHFGTGGFTLNAAIEHAHRLNAALVASVVRSKP